MDIQLPDGKTLVNASPEDATARGIAATTVAEAETAAAAMARKGQLRGQIHMQAGDQLSLIGANADASALLMVEMAKLARALSTATSVAEVNAAAQPFADLTQSFFADVEAGALNLPYLVKGDAPAALLDIQTRADKAAQAFIAVQGDQS
ncbi:MAG: hypothetical protein AAGI09_02940 [Pseudomonadota bacterium]